MTRASLAALLFLMACDGGFPDDRAEACILKTAQDATKQLTTMGGLVQGLTRDPAVQQFDIGAMTIADIAFGTCTETGTGQFQCGIEYAVDFSGDGGEALVEMARLLGQDIEARRLETWNFRFGPTVTECSPV